VAEEIGEWMVTAQDVTITTSEVDPRIPQRSAKHKAQIIQTGLDLEEEDEGEVDISRCSCSICDIKLTTILIPNTHKVTDKQRALAEKMGAVEGSLDLRGNDSAQGRQKVQKHKDLLGNREGCLGGRGRGTPLRCLRCRVLGGKQPQEA
jgi:hypothetical protein